MTPCEKRSSYDRHNTLFFHYTFSFFLTLPSLAQRVVDSRLDGFLPKMHSMILYLYKSGSYQSWEYFLYQTVKEPKFQVDDKHLFCVYTFAHFFQKHTNVCFQ